MNKKLNLYFLSVIGFMFIVPVVCTAIDITSNPASGFVFVMGKWFIFSGIGLRLFTAGLKQAITPSFTSRKIMNSEGNESGFFIRELGFANISIGSAGIISLFIETWRTPSAFIGGLFLGIAGLLHVIKKPSGFNETVAMVSDLFIFAVLAVYLIAAL